MSESPVIVVGALAPLATAAPFNVTAASSPLAAAVAAPIPLVVPAVPSVTVAYRSPTAPVMPEKLFRTRLWMNTSAPPTAPIVPTPFVSPMPVSEVEMF